MFWDKHPNINRTILNFKLLIVPNQLSWLFVFKYNCSCFMPFGRSNRLGSRCHVTSCWTNRLLHKRNNSRCRCGLGWLSPGVCRNISVITISRAVYIIHCHLNHEVIDLQNNGKLDNYILNGMLFMLTSLMNQMKFELSHKLFCCCCCRKIR